MVSVCFIMVYVFSFFKEVGFGTYYAVKLIQRASHCVFNSGTMQAWTEAVDIKNYNPKDSPQQVKPEVIMMIPRIPQKTVRRLIAAEGYLELGMPVQALRELDQVKDPGSLTASYSYLRGESLKRIGRYTEAIKPLQYAADLLPIPHSQLPWKSLGACYRESGQNDLAENAEQTANEIASEAKVHLRFEPLGEQFQPVVEHQVHLTITFEPVQEVDETDSDEPFFLENDDDSEDFGIEPEED